MTTTSDFLSWEYDSTTPITSTSADSAEAEAARKVAASYEAAFDRDAAKLLAIAQEEARLKEDRTRLEKELLRRFPESVGSYVARSNAFAVHVERGSRRRWDQTALAAFVDSAATKPDFIEIEQQLKVNLDKIPAAEQQAVLDAYSTVQRGRATIKVTPIK